MDFLTKYKGSIDVGGKSVTITVGSTVVHCKTSPPDNVGVARSVYEVTVPPQSQILIPVKLSRIPEGSVALLEPVVNLENKLNLACAKAVLTCKKGRSVCRLLNPTNVDICITANTPLGKLLPVDIDSISEIKDASDSTTEESNATVFEVSTEIDNVKLVQIAKDLGIPLGEADLTEDQKTQLLQFIGKNRDVFASSLQELGCTNVHFHKIETGDAPPQRQRFYRHSPAIKAEVERQVKDMLDNGVIEHSLSVWNAPVVMIKKRSGEYRFAVDYRKLNSITQPISFPLPRLEDVFDSVGECKPTLFSVLDLASGFWQIPLDEETKHKSAFVTHHGVFQFRRLPFGLMNAPMSFQMVMSQVLRSFLEICTSLRRRHTYFQQRFQRAPSASATSFRSLACSKSNIKTDKMPVCTEKS